MAVYRRGETYWIDFYYQGERYRRQAGGNHKHARAALSRIQGRIADGTFDPGQLDPEPEPEPAPLLTFGAFAETFLAEHTGRRRSNHYPATIKRLRRHWEDVALSAITRRGLEDYRRRLEVEPRVPGKPPLSPTTVLKLLRAMHRVLRFAVQRDIIPANPAAELEKPSAARSRTRYLTRDEFEALRAACPPWLRPLVTFAVLTGMRLKEITELRRGDADLAARVVHVPMDSKTGTRPVPLGTAALAVVEGQPRRLRSTRLFHDDDGPIDSERRRARVSHRVQKAAKAADLPGVSFHTLRHTAASWMVQAGVPLYEVQKVLGHSSPLLTQRYAHLAPDFGRTAAAALDAAMAPVGESRSHNMVTSGAGAKVADSAK